MPKHLHKGARRIPSDSRVCLGIRSMLTSRCILIPRDGISRSLKKPERETGGEEGERDREKGGRERERKDTDRGTGNTDGFLLL